MRRNKILAKALALFGATLFSGLAAGCGSGGPTPGSTQTVSRDITGFGATNAAWNRTHTKVHDYPSSVGDAYDADPSLDLGRKAHYTGVWMPGRVLQYDYAFNPRPIATAKSDVLRTQFPPDAKVAWFAVKTKLFPGGSGSPCAQMIVTSETLAKVLDTKAIGDAQGALVYFYSHAADGHWDPKAVVSAHFQLGGAWGPGLRREKEGKC